MAQPLNGRALHVAGAHTDIGKTEVACALIRAARRRDFSCDAFKPVLSGFSSGRIKESDAGRLLAALGRPWSDVDAVSPLRFEAPLAPPMAARREGRRLQLAEIIDLCRAWLAQSSANFRLLEGAGGVMSPIAEDGLVLDLAAQLDLPSVLVVGGYLGAVSHALTALQVMQGRGLEVLAVVASEAAEDDAPAFDETLEMLRTFGGGAPVVAAPRAHDRWAEPLLDLLLHGEGA